MKNKCWKIPFSLNIFLKDGMCGFDPCTSTGLFFTLEALKLLHS